MKWIVTITYRVEAETEEAAIEAVDDVLSTVDSDPALQMTWMETTADAVEEGP